MAKKPTVVASDDKTTEIYAFTSLPMKWREICYQFAAKKNYTHQEIMQLSFKIGKFDRTVHEAFEAVK